MLTEILRYIRNYFPMPDKAVDGNFTIENGTIGLSNVTSGQYYMIEGSRLNDGVYLYPTINLVDESFKGRITPLAIPKDVIMLSTEIADYCEKYKTTPYQSESFGGYSYTRLTDASWQNAFATRLNTWRKI